MKKKKVETAGGTPSKKGKKKWILIGVIAIIILGAISGGGGDKNNEVSQEASASGSNVESVENLDSTTEEPASNQAITDEYTLEHGDLLGVVENEIDGRNVMVVKAKISSSYSNEATIHQNYYNVDDLIRSQGCDKFDEIQYWAVADMSNGSEEKVVSFTLDADTIKEIAAGSIPANTLGDHVTDLWLHASLRDDNIPEEYKSALNKANTYSDTMHMSKAGIYDQLTSEYGEKFAPEAAQYAIDSMNADWNANALIKAQEYSDTMYMSKAAIYDQLTSEYGEKFTADEAQYAIDNIKADWNANALKKAKEYQENMDMSLESIRDQLSSEYGEKFTQDEADYAVESLN